MAELGKPIISAAFARRATQKQDRAEQVLEAQRVAAEYAREQTLADMLGDTLVQKEVPEEVPTDETPVAKPKRTRTKKTVD